MKHNSGFTLIEMICSIVIIGILAALVTGYMSSQAQLFSLATNDQDLNQNARVMLDRVATEIRQADTLTLTSATDFTLTADIDNDGVAETVRYYLSGNVIHKTVDAADQSILNNVSAFTCALEAGNTILTIQNLTFASNQVSKSYGTSILMRRKLT